MNSQFSLKDSILQSLQSSKQFFNKGYIHDDIVTKYIETPSSTSFMSNKQEIISKLITSCFGIGVSLIISYYGLKWLSNALDPTKAEKKEAQDRAKSLMKKIGVDNIKLTEYELCIASNLVDPLSMSISWDDIGGLDELVRDIQETVILPFKHHSLFSKSPLLQPPKGVLLHGPPGCGKTMIAKSTAKAAGARFLNLQVSALVDKWYGESQKRAEAVFSLAVKLQPVIIFIDEIDSFLRSRTSSDHEATAMIKTQFMSFWDGLVTETNNRIMIMGATNRPQDVDAAILRRMPSMFYVGLPGKEQRKGILELILKDDQVDQDVNFDRLAEHTQSFSGSDLRELCRNASILRVREYLRKENSAEVQQIEDRYSEENLRGINANDFSAALVKMKEAKLAGSSSIPNVISLD